jgi:hypothetical protein
VYTDREQGVASILETNKFSLNNNTTKEKEIRFLSKRFVLSIAFTLVAALRL